MTQMNDTPAVLLRFDPKFSNMIDSVTKLFIKKRSVREIMSTRPRVRIAAVAKELGFEILPSSGTASLIQSIAYQSGYRNPLITEGEWNRTFVAIAVREFKQM